jgi:RNA polymerase sigma factor (TIGR02999 family)
MSVCASPVQDTVTRLLAERRAGNREVLDALVPLIYEQLRRIAHWHLRSERDEHTLSTTALVHEAYLQLVDQNRAPWQSRAHFLAIASQAMRRILIDHARKHRAAKRGGGRAPLTLDDELIMSEERSEALLALDEALSRLEAINERLGLTVQYRYFGSLTIDEAAEVLQVSPATVKRDWRTAKAWLHHELACEH